MAQENDQRIEVRNVWASNLITECNHIKDSVESYSFVSIRGKYILHCSGYFENKYMKADPQVYYDILRLQIGNLPFIQLGMTLSNSNQELPVIEGHPTIWLFHFSTSDSKYCPKTLCEASLVGLELRGIDFERNQNEGVDPAIFRDIMIQHGFWKKVSMWISFTTICDFGYLVKLFMGKNRYPETMEELVKEGRSFLGEELYDVKEMAQLMDLSTGSLEEVGDAIGVHRVAESEEENAGFDSHLVMQLFMRLKKYNKVKDGMKSLTKTI